MILLGVGRAINLLVPLSFGALVGALSNREDPWFYLGAYVALRFMQGSGGILNVLQTNLWIVSTRLTMLRLLTSLKSACRAILRPRNDCKLRTPHRRQILIEFSAAHVLQSLAQSINELSYST